MPYFPMAELGGATRLGSSDTVSWSRITGGIITATELILAGGTKGVLRSQNYDASSAGWAIFGDGSAFFYGDVTLGANAIFLGDVYSGNWDGTIPANLATVDSATS